MVKFGWGFRGHVFAVWANQHIRLWRIHKGMEVLTVQIYLKLGLISTAAHRIACSRMCLVGDRCISLLLPLQASCRAELRQLQSSKSSCSHFFSSESLHNKTYGLLNYRFDSSCTERCMIFYIQSLHVWIFQK